MAATDLGKLVGSILADLTAARLRADIATIQAAEMYQQDALMQLLPVPRFRVPEIQVEVPVLIADVIAPDGEDEMGLPQDPKNILPEERDIREVLDNAVAYAGMKLGDDDFRKLVAEVNERLSQLWRSPPGLLRAHRISNDLQRAAESAIQRIDEQRPDDEERVGNSARFSLAVRLGIQQRLVRKLAGRSRLSVLASAKDLKSAGDEGHLVNIRLTIQEEAYELKIGDDDVGDFVEHFVPE